MPARLKLRITKKIDESYTLADGMTLGRSDGNDIVLLDGAISRVHARIEERGSHFFVMDTGSANGILVNGDRTTEHMLVEGDDLQIGNKRLSYTEAEPLAPEPSYVVDITKKPLASYPMATIIDSEDVLLIIPTIEPLMEMIYEIVSQMVITSPLEGETEQNFITAVQQGVRNAATHGNQWSPGKLIRLRYARDAEKVVVLIADQGPGFDYKLSLSESRKVGRKTVIREEFLKTAKTGRGLVRMLAAVDAVEYNEKGNEVILTKFVDAPGSGETKWVAGDMPTRRQGGVRNDGETLRQTREPEPIEPGEADLDELIHGGRTNRHSETELDNSQLLETDEFDPLDDPEELEL